ncbi:MAG: type IV toxin-antitoxin system AbiEi family antitoxin domain-containing protein [Candidatus Sabulitectum sp.]|nr:type IV toxin-antitoxin system AbiEi family antitoxin domain-containing protein [Candidatus Sabulitectum sp.]
MSTLRPELIMELLVSSRSVRVKHLFLWSTERTGHGRFDSLDSARMNLGMGKRQLYVGGRYDSKYWITVPAESPEVLPDV